MSMLLSKYPYLQSRIEKIQEPSKEVLENIWEKIAAGQNLTKEESDILIDTMLLYECKIENTPHYLQEAYERFYSSGKWTLAMERNIFVSDDPPVSSSRIGPTLTAYQGKI